MTSRRWPLAPARRAWLGGSLLALVALGIGVSLGRAPKAASVPGITLWSAEDQPLRSAWVELRCGHERHRVVSNERGAIALPGSCHDTPIVEGFELLRTETSKQTGFHFSARGLLRFEMTDRQGTPLAHVPTTVTLNLGPDEVVVADAVHGVAEFPNAPLALPTRLIQIFPSERGWAFADLRARRTKDGVVYSVRLERRRAVPADLPEDGILS